MPISLLSEAYFIGGGVARGSKTSTNSSSQVYRTAPLVYYAYKTGPRCNEAPPKPLYTFEPMRVSVAKRQRVPLDWQRVAERKTEKLDRAYATINTLHSKLTSKQQELVELNEERLRTEDQLQSRIIELTRKLDELTSKLDGIGAGYGDFSGSFSFGQSVRTPPNEFAESPSDSDEEEQPDVNVAVGEQWPLLDPDAVVVVEVPDKIELAQRIDHWPPQIIGRPEHTTGNDANGLLPLFPARFSRSGPIAIGNLELVLLAARVVCDDSNTPRSLDEITEHANAYRKEPISRTAVLNVLKTNDHATHGAPDDQLAFVSVQRNGHTLWKVNPHGNAASVGAGVPADWVELYFVRRPLAWISDATATF